MTIKPANINYNEQGTPVAVDFDDVYFSNHNGLAETQYVFLQQNHLPQRWTSHKQHVFTIGETGFGTGLNFLATWQQFSAQPSCQARLHFISTEKFPLTRDDLERALAAWPSLAEFAHPLVESYPDVLAGGHRLVFEQGRVILDLHMGEATAVFAELHNQPNGLIDAWYLDGFAPSKNPHMWTAQLFHQLARLSKPNATFATFTAAGAVKRGLKEAGFNVRKVKGFGRKREMLAGEIADIPTTRSTQRYFQRNGLNLADPQRAPHVAVIGGGIAAANLALSLVQKGVKVSVICKDNELAKGASGNPQGGFYPQLNAQANIASRLQALSFGFAQRRYQQILAQGFNFSHQWCGVIQLAFNDAVALRQSNLVSSAIWPNSLIEPISPNDATQIAGIPLPYDGLLIAKGGWISPPELVEATIAYAQRTGDCQLVLNAHVQKVQPTNSGWQVDYATATAQVDAVVFATGADTLQFEQCQHLPFNLVRGQVESLPSQPPLDQLKTVLCHKGYLTPAFNGQHALGSTYVKSDTSRAYRKQEQQSNLQTHQKALSKTEWAAELAGNNSGRAAIRCSLPDHLPVAGALFDTEVQTAQFKDLYKALPIDKYEQAKDLNGLYILAGLGSRGLTTAPLMAEIVASQIVQEALPLDNQLLAALNPNRYLIKSLIRRQEG
ncbi:bifunctional tRNA (5-methylaminomethyl-2-thiouridine)(34)-methyltransferase MnmD/FAD-dependent 5-carboxymethylaminomethyl-2-thiouridine(34) oxidoreductase MnmC [Aliiglaciecola litoralis]|uniref:tRNA 5-methylaminomethyl-2-thiouridine biosynthesis bifunctional protein MnmC n=1 Tax=Aliiglaciecola litoralis TaxID=582857 RepID=A0ABP3WY76_9ALTE